MVKYVPQGTTKTWCQLDLESFPFDFQNCYFELESWTMDTTLFHFSNESKAFVDDAIDSTQWHLCKRQSKVYEYTYNFSHSVDTFSRLRFEISIQRKSTFYIVSFIFPCATVSLIQLLTFFVPSKDTIPDRIGFAMTNMLSLIVFQTMITEEMPKSSDAITSLTDYIGILVVIATLLILESLGVEKILRRNSQAPPKILLFIVRMFPMLWEPPSGTGSSKQACCKAKEQKKTQPNLNKQTVRLVRIHNHHFDFNSISSKIKGVIPSDHLAPLESPISAIKCRYRKHQKQRLKAAEEAKSLRKCYDQPLPITYWVVPDNVYCNVEDGDDDGDDDGGGLKAKMKRIRNRNGRLWEEVVTRIDCFLFIVACILTVVVPCWKFIPPALQKEVCPLRSHQNE